ncbi:DUF6518 family protein [Amycolatopsis sp. DSM 110486]|uniref:DUF6518 family protein n=1 Tax=Amycolatopsis sp. DSM 110486 TaxID=2865832 RepID=UPI001C69DF63|nr:DUF6518 family protein [Amycolatopsis sp. DSM 110486]QYN25531.1 hypothetical protein K1T34_25775 [Amycolatopsis sp. DSM 110486]
MQKIVALAGGVVLGAGTYLTQLTPFGWTTNSIATWSALAFLVGCAGGRPSWRVATAAVGSLLLALVVWYGVAQAVNGLYSASALVTAVVWAVGGVLAGIVFGLGAAWWRPGRTAGPAPSASRCWSRSSRWTGCTGSWSSARPARA